MKIDGKAIAARLLIQLQLDVVKLTRRSGIPPHLAVIYIGNDSASASFIKQKEQAASRTGVILTVHRYRRAPLYQKLAEFIKTLNRDKTVHGIIIQRPLPSSLSSDSLTKLVSPTKDVDGFLEKSIFIPPLSLAVFKIFNEIYFTHIKKSALPKDDFTKPLLHWLKEKRLVLIGRGETGGKPIAKTLSSVRLNYILLNSQVESREDYLKEADIVISAVGKPRMITPVTMKKGAILIGVGIRTDNDRLKGDFEEKEVMDEAGFYTPTPGGIGPVNVACLVSNVVTACKNQSR